MKSGEVVGKKYRLVGEIGRGGHGVVYEARHVELGRRVAVKLLEPARAADRDAQKRLEREARAAGSLAHENIAAITDLGTTETSERFLVMEYLEGEDLRSMIARAGRISPERAVSLIVQACRGVARAHAAGIVHRDLKPSNLFVTRRADGSDLLKVLDFGVAKLLGAAAEDVTASGFQPGTACYMSPEQARGERVDARSDVHALGAILYELLTGEKAHSGETQNAVLYHVMTQRPTPLSDLSPDLPQPLVSAVERALEPDPARRFPSAEAFCEALAPGSLSLAASAPTERSFDSDPATRTSEGTLDPADPSTRTSRGTLGPARSAPRSVALVALAGVGLVLVVAWLAFGRNAPERAPVTPSAPSPLARIASVASSVVEPPAPSSSATAADAALPMPSAPERVLRLPRASSSAPVRHGPRVDRTNPYP